MKIAFIAGAMAVLAGMSLCPEAIGATSPKKEVKTEKGTTLSASILL